MVCCSMESKYFNKHGALPSCTQNGKSCGVLAIQCKQGFTLIDPILFVLKMLSAYYVCCIYLNGHLGKNTMKADQTDPKEQSDLDP